MCTIGTGQASARAAVEHLLMQLDGMAIFANAERRHLVGHRGECVADIEIAGVTALGHASSFRTCGVMARRHSTLSPARLCAGCDIRTACAKAETELACEIQSPNTQPTMSSPSTAATPSGPT